MIFLFLRVVFVVSRVESSVIGHGMVGLGISHVHDFEAEGVLGIISSEHVENGLLAGLSRKDQISLIVVESGSFAGRDNER